MIMIVSDKIELKREANYLLRNLFSIDRNEIIEDLYVEAHDYIFIKSTIEIINIDITKMIDRSIDPESVEFALRITNKDNLLTKKIQILTYLIESQRIYNEKFNNFENRFFIGFITLAFHTIRSIYLLIKGKCLISIHRLDKV